MKKVSLIASALILLVPGFMNAEDVIAMQDSSKKASKDNEVTPYVEYNNRMVVFTINNLTYEHTQPNGMYAAFDSWYTGAWSSHHQGTTSVLESELRFGYNFFYNGSDHITPFGGVGYFKDLKKGHHSLHGIGYVSIGGRYDHEFTSNVNVGMNAKALFGGSPSKNHHGRWSGFVGGIEVSFPVTFRFGPQRHWDVRVEPFNILLAGKHLAVNYFGFRLTVGYRF